MATPLDPALLARRYRASDTEDELRQQQMSLGPLREQLLREQVRSAQQAPERLLQQRLLKEKELGIKSAAQKALERYQQGRVAALGKTGGVKLKPGERLTEEGTVEQIPGSAEYLKQSGLHAKDYHGLLTAEDIASSAEQKIDYILDPKRRDAFEMNFGGWNAYVTQLAPDTVTTGTLDVKERIASLKNEMMVAGLNLLRAGGSVGQMTQQEWPIVRDMIQKLSPALSEAEAKSTLEEIKARFKSIANNTRKAYETEWEGSQYAKRAKGKTPPAAPSAAAPVGPYSDAEKERRYQEYKRQRAQK